MDVSILDQYPPIVYFIVNRLSFIEAMCGSISVLFIFIFSIKFLSAKREYKWLQQEKMQSLSKLGERELMLQKLVKEWVETLKRAEDNKSLIANKLDKLDPLLPDKKYANGSCSLRKTCEEIKISEKTLDSCSGNLDYLADRIDDRLTEQPLLNREIYEIESQMSILEKWITLYFGIIVFFTFVLVITFIVPNTHTALNLITHNMVDKSLPLEEIEQATYDLKMLIIQLY